MKCNNCEREVNLFWILFWIRLSHGLKCELTLEDVSSAAREKGLVIARDVHCKRCGCKHTLFCDNYGVMTISLMDL